MQESKVRNYGGEGRVDAQKALETGLWNTDQFRLWQDAIDWVEEGKLGSGWRVGVYPSVESTAMLGDAS